jgi:hypothetical protein
MLLRPVLPAAALLALLALPALAQQRPPAAAGPSRIGSFQDWTAASYQEGGQRICYAFARASRSDPARSGVILTVTHRSQGATRSRSTPAMPSRATPR